MNENFCISKNKRMLNYKLTLLVDYMEILVLKAYSSYLLSFVTRIGQAYLDGKGRAVGGFGTHAGFLFLVSFLCHLFLASLKILYLFYQIGII